MKYAGEEEMTKERSILKGRRIGSHEGARLSFEESTIGDMIVNVYPRDDGRRSDQAYLSLEELADLQCELKNYFNDSESQNLVVELRSELADWKYRCDQKERIIRDREKAIAQKRTTITTLNDDLQKVISDREKLRTAAEEKVAAMKRDHDKTKREYEEKLEDLRVELSRWKPEEVRAPQMEDVW